MATLQLRFVRGGGFSSKVIEWFSAGAYSHVDYVMGDGQLLGSRSDSIGGKPPGVQVRPVRYTGNEPAAVFELDVHDKDKLAYEAFLLAQVGKPYDFPGIWGFAFERDWREEDSWFCSELQAAALGKTVLRRDLNTIASKVTPAALSLVWSTLGASVKVYAEG